MLPYKMGDNPPPQPPPLPPSGTVQDWNEPKKPKPEDEGDDEQQKPANA